MAVVLCSAGRVNQIEFNSLLCAAPPWAHTNTHTQTYPYAHTSAPPSLRLSVAIFLAGPLCNAQIAGSRPSRVASSIRSCVLLTACLLTAASTQARADEGSAHVLSARRTASWSRAIRRWLPSFTPGAGVRRSMLWSPASQRTTGGACISSSACHCCCWWWCCCC